MNCLVLFLIAALAVVTTALSTKSETGDLYVFAYSWTPEFCYGNNYPGCAAPQDYWKNDFTIHGLWPQYSAGGYPSNCNTEPFDPQVPLTIGWDTMTKYWPDVQYAETSPDYDQFWEHEWTKHGTCSGLTQLQYFQNGIDLIQKFGTPSYVTDNVGGNITAATLRTDMGGASMVSLQCQSGSYLVGAYTCWSSVNGIPTAQIVCPTDVQGEDTCTKDTIIVQKL